MPRCALLSHHDSNLDQENQNLLCCRYTIGQIQVWITKYEVGLQCQVSGIKTAAKVRRLVFHTADGESIDPDGRIGGDAGREGWFRYNCV